jgi:ribonucleoside-diphosphate reductase alpha chain
MKIQCSLASVLVEDVCSPQLKQDEIDQLKEYITDLKFIPGGRYLYYAGRPNKFFNNCYLLKAEEDTREDWADLSWKSESCLMTGGGIGVDYSVYREEGRVLSGTGGLASGPIPKMLMINEIGRRVMQGGSRRSAIYASMNWKHADVEKFLVSKNWYDMPVGNTGFTIGQVKEQDFNYHLSRMYDKPYKPPNRDSLLTSLIKKMKHYVMHVLKLLRRTIRMYVT